MPQVPSTPSLGTSVRRHSRHLCRHLRRHLRRLTALMFVAVVSNTAGCHRVIPETNVRAVPPLATVGGDSTWHTPLSPLPGLPVRIERFPRHEPFSREIALAAQREPKPCPSSLRGTLARGTVTGAIGGYLFLRMFAAFWTKDPDIPADVRNRMILGGAVAGFMRAGWDYAGACGGGVFDGSSIDGRT